jgi:hypothetical protein
MQFIQRDIPVLGTGSSGKASLNGGLAVTPRLCYGVLESVSRQQNHFLARLY